MIPLARMDCANSSMRSCWKTRRGCSRLGSISSMGICATSSPRWGGSAQGGAVGRVGSSALSPLPSALRGLSTFLFILQNLLGEADIALRAARADVIGQDCLPMTGSFSEANTARNNGLEDLFAEEVSEIVGYLAG